MRLQQQPRWRLQGRWWVLVLGVWVWVVGVQGVCMAVRMAASTGREQQRRAAGQRQWAVVIAVQWVVQWVVLWVVVTAVVVWQLWVRAWSH